MVSIWFRFGFFVALLSLELVCLDGYGCFKRFICSTSDPVRSRTPSNKEAVDYDKFLVADQVEDGAAKVEGIVNSVAGDFIAQAPQVRQEQTDELNNLREHHQNIPSARSPEIIDEINRYKHIHTHIHTRDFAYIKELSL